MCRSHLFRQDWLLPEDHQEQAHWESLVCSKEIKGRWRLDSLTCFALSWKVCWDVICETKGAVGAPFIRELSQTSQPQSLVSQTSEQGATCTEAAVTGRGKAKAMGYVMHPNSVGLGKSLNSSWPPVLPSHSKGALRMTELAIAVRGSSVCLAWRTSCGKAGQGDG